MWSADEARQIVKSAAPLEDHQRAVVVLRYVEGLSVAETATALDLSERSIRSLERRALKHLATLRAR